MPTPYLTPDDVDRMSAHQIEVELTEWEVRLREAPCRTSAAVALHHVGVLEAELYCRDEIERMAAQAERMTLSLPALAGGR